MICYHLSLCVNSECRKWTLENSLRTLTALYWIRQISVTIVNHLFTKMHFEFEWTSLKLNRCPLSTLFFYFNLLHFLILNVQLYGYFNQTFGSSKVCQYVMPDFSHFYSPFKIAMIIEKNWSSFESGPKLRAIIIISVNLCKKCTFKSW